MSGEASKNVRSLIQAKSSSFLTAVPSGWLAHGQSIGRAAGRVMRKSPGGCRWPPSGRLLAGSATASREWRSHGTGSGAHLGR